MTDPSENNTTKLIGTSTKIAVVLCLAAIVITLCLVIMLTIFNGYSKKQCAYCESSDVKYEAFFVPSGTSEYLCEKCYQKRKPFPDYWIVKPAQVIKITKHNGIYNVPQQ